MNVLELNLGYLCCGFGFGSLLWFTVRCIRLLLNVAQIGLGQVE